MRHKAEADNRLRALEAAGWFSASAGGSSGSRRGTGSRGTRSTQSAGGSGAAGQAQLGQLTPADLEERLNVLHRVCRPLRARFTSDPETDPEADAAAGDAAADVVDDNDGDDGDDDDVPAGGNAVASKPLAMRQLAAAQSGAGQAEQAAHLQMVRGDGYVLDRQRRSGGTFVPVGTAYLTKSWLLAACGEPLSVEEEGPEAADARLAAAASNTVAAMAAAAATAAARGGPSCPGLAVALVEKMRVICPTKDSVCFHSRKARKLLTVRDICCFRSGWRARATRALRNAQEPASTPSRGCRLRTKTSAWTPCLG